MAEDEVEGPMQTKSAVMSLESEVASEVDAATMNVNDLRARSRVASASLRQIGIFVPSNTAGGSVDDVVENYENIVVDGNTFRTVQRWIAHLRGKTPESVVAACNREGEQLIVEFDNTLNIANGELYAMSEQLNAINTQYEDIRSRTKNHLDIAKQYRANIDRVNTTLAGFRSSDQKKKDEIYAEFAPALKDDRRYTDDVRDLKLMQALRSERNRLGLELNKKNLEIKQLQARATQLTHQYRGKERSIADYEARVHAAELNFEPVRQYILGSMVLVEPSSSGVARANQVIDKSIRALGRHAEKKVPYVAMVEQRRTDEEARGLNPLPDLPSFEQYHDDAYNGTINAEHRKLGDAREQELAAMDDTLYRN